MAFVIGIDAGGSKTAACIGDTAGKTVIRRVFPYGLNLNSLDQTHVYSQIFESLYHLLKETQLNIEDCVSCILGIAGADIAKNKEDLILYLQNKGLLGCLSVKNDLTSLLEYICYCKNECSSAILASGTGSICRVLINGTIHTVGGFGHWFGDEGSGYDIGRNALRAVSQMEDGRLAKSSLYHILCTSFQVENIKELLSELKTATDSTAFIASIATIVGNAAKKGDQHAMTLLNNASFELYNLACTAIDRSGYTNNKIYAIGSNLIKQPIMLKKISRMLLDNRNIYLDIWKEAPDICNMKMAALQLKGKK